MLNNNLSNKVPPCFAFRVEDFVMIKKSDNKIVSSMLKFANKDYVLNQQVMTVLYHIFKHTDYSVELIVSQDFYNRFHEVILQEIPFNRVIYSNKPVEIAIKLNTNEIDYYVDSDLERKSQIGHQRCIDLAVVWHLIKKV